MTAAAALAAELRFGPGVAHKRDIAAVADALGLGAASAIPVGDDCAAIPDGDVWQLFAGEGFLDGFVARDPWFAGYCGVMVNLADIAAMGGRPTAILDILWADGADQARRVLEGLKAAAVAYGVPIVGGHTNLRSGATQFGAAVLGRARRLISSFDARPGDDLVFAVDLRGRYREPDAYWDASTQSSPERLRGDLEILPTLAEDRLTRAGKDISMAGFVGTALMLLECSGVGAILEADAIPRPEGAPLARWLQSFPSYGFVLSVTPSASGPVIARFADRGIAAAVAGRVTGASQLRLRLEGDEAVFWDLEAEPLIGCGPARSPTQAGHA